MHELYNVIYQLISKDNNKCILVGIEKGKMFEISFFSQMKFPFLLTENVTINYEPCDFFSKALKIILLKTENIFYWFQL